MYGIAIILRNIAEQVKISLCPMVDAQRLIADDGAALVVGTTHLKCRRID